MLGSGVYSGIAGPLVVDQRAINRQRAQINKISQVLMSTEDERALILDRSRMNAPVAGVEASTRIFPQDLKIGFKRDKSASSDIFNGGVSCSW